MYPSNHIGSAFARSVPLARSNRWRSARASKPVVRVMRQLFRLICVCSVGVVSLIGCAQSAGDGAAGGAGGSGVSFPCTEAGIRDAIASGDGPHAFECDGPTTVVTTAEIAIDADVILDGDGALTVDGARDHRVFSVPEDVRAELRGVVVTGGVAHLGGGILNAGILTLMNSVVSGSSAAEGGGIHNVKAGTMTLLGTTVLANDASLGAGIFNDGTLTAVHSIVTENTSEAGGGGIFNERELTLIDTSVSDNTAGGSGGGISNIPGGDGNDGPGRLTLLQSIVSGNTAGFNGGGIHSEGTATLTSSTVSANRGASGGGVYVRGDFTVVSGTVSGNVSESCGGGIDNDGTVSLANTTISGNTAVDCGGGIYNQTLLTVTSSTFSANAAERGGALGSDVAEKEGATSLANTLIDGDCDSDVPLISNGYNIESPGDTCGLDEAAGDMVGVTAEQLDLGPLQDNGGFVQTHAITTDSAAFDVIPESMCQVDEDEREVTRPQGDACDVGAFELEM